MKRVGIIGCGSIGTQVALAIDNAKISDTVLEFLFDSDSDATKSLTGKLKSSTVRCFSDFSDLISSTQFKASNLVLESASQAAVRLFAKRVLELGKDLIVMSVGALADDHLLSDLLASSDKYDTSLLLPTGAIAGIDAIRSAKGALDSVELITTKNPKALEGAPFFEKNRIRLDSITQETTIYQGTAADAILNFPSNVNVASILAIAGVGMERTKVRIVADPAIHYNQHQIIAEGTFGKLDIKLMNYQAEGNPKTSFLAILSAIETVRSASRKNFRIGT